MDVADYRAPWWLPGGHLQTLWRKLGAAPVMQRERSRVELQDGDFIDLDWLPAEGASGGARQRPLIVLLHGLAGCSSSPYILSMQSLLQKYGYDTVAMNLRGCSGEFNRLARTYHSGCSDDLEQVVQAILRRDGAGRRLGLIGYSLGANVLVKWLSETGLSPQVTAAVSVSNPFSLALCCDRMNHGVALWYGRYFVQRLRTDLMSKTRYLESLGRDDELGRIRALGPLDKLGTLWDFDEAVTAPLHGFAGAEDYYQRCSSRNFVGSVQVPALIIHGHNDPIIPTEALPEAGELPVSVHIEILPGGGHVGFPARGQPLWLERRVLCFLECCLTGCQFAEPQLIELT
jgi:uncharacterized protein